MQNRLDFFSHKGIVAALMAVENQIEKSTLDIIIKELVRLRASQINGCAFCLDMHVADARKHGESERRLATVSSWRETTFFNERERGVGVDRIADACVGKP